MTTNKPEVVAWYFPSSKTTLPVVSLNARNVTGQALIRLADYEALQAEHDLEALRRDAELYRTLRAMHWHSSPLAVVRNPKVAIKPGHDCPSGDRLDEILKEYMSETQNPGEA